MTATLLRLKFIALVALVMTSALACSSGSNPIVPEPTNPPPSPGPGPAPVPNPNLGVQYNLLDSNGNPTTMWVKFISVDPPMGQTPHGETMCGGVCFVFKITAEIGKEHEPNRRSYIGFTFSDDCLDGEDFLPAGGNVNPGDSMVVSSQTFKRLDSKPRCLVARGYYSMGEKTTYGYHALNLGY